MQSPLSAAHHLAASVASIDMVLKIDQQMQFRVGSIEFLGVNTGTQEKLMESLAKPGEIFEETRLDEFFKVSRSILPSDASKKTM